jgi:hypothetical protein
MPNILAPCLLSPWFHVEKKTAWLMYQASLVVSHLGKGIEIPSHEVLLYW